MERAASARAALNRLRLSRLLSVGVSPVAPRSWFRLAMLSFIWLAPYTGVVENGEHMDQSSYQFMHFGGKWLKCCEMYVGCRLGSRLPATRLCSAFRRRGQWATTADDCWA
jgi:hypothetical protein